ncbi:AAA family ATPase [Mesorhizobium sp. M0166]|uniref:AAA family ATPase n=1 Tax=Mesorhizobium sp. M0027 TaxID=2956848 RepID=UPI0033373A04
MEEPEAHLHPQLQRSVFKKLLGNVDASQAMIVTSHSPTLAAVTPLRSIVQLRSRPGRPRRSRWRTCRSRQTRSTTLKPTSMRHPPSYCSPEASFLSKATRRRRSCLSSLHYSVIRWTSLGSLSAMSAV